MKGQGDYYMQRLDQFFIDLTMTDMRHGKLNRACRELGINEFTLVDVKREDFLIPEFTIMVLEELNEVQDILQARMNEEEANSTYYGLYTNCDLFIEAMIVLTSCIDNLEDLLETLI